MAATPVCDDTALKAAAILLAATVVLESPVPEIVTPFTVIAKAVASVEVIAVKVAELVAPTLAVTPV